MMKQQLASFTVLLCLTFCSVSNGFSQWIPSTGIPGGSVGALLVNGTDLYASLGFNGVFLSTDSGKNWTKISANLKAEIVKEFATSGPNLVASTDSGVFVTSDRGLTWQKSVGLPANAFPRGLSDLTSSGHSLFGILDNLFYISTDNGLTWGERPLPLLTGSYGLDRLGGSPNSTNMYGVGWYTDKGKRTIVRTSDQGLTWNVMDSLWDHDNINGEIKSFFVLPGNANTKRPESVFALTYLEGMFVSTDSGVSWRDANAGLQSKDVLTFGATDANPPVLIAGTNEGVFISTDNGTSWSIRSAGLTDTRVHTIALKGSTLFAGTNDGVSISSNDGVSWNGINIDLENPLVTGFIDLDSLLLAGTERGVFRSLDHGASWSRFGDKHNPIVYTFAKNITLPRKLYGTTGGRGDIQRSTDDGLTWENIFPIETYGSYAVLVNNRSLVAATNIGVFVSKRGDTAWSWPKIGPKSIVRTFALIDYNRFVPLLFAGTDNQGVLQSMDNGSTWSEINAGLTNRAVHVLTIPDPRADQPTIFAGTNDGVFRSTDDGGSWTTSSLGITDTSVITIVGKEKNLFAGTTHQGVFFSSNSGITWQSISEGLPQAQIEALSISDNNLVAGTSNAGIWHRPLSEIVKTSSVAVAQPKEKSISVYPNPSTESTAIHFTSLETESTTVSIVNLLGKEEAMLFSGELGKGEHAVYWNASALPQGVYWCTVKTRSGVQCRSILHLR